MDNKDVEHVSDIIGEWGSYQKKYLVFCVISGFINALNNMGYTFHAPKTDFWCADMPEWMNGTGRNDTDHCVMYWQPNTPCDRWRYDTSVFDATIISEFDLVCERSWYASLTQSLYQSSYIITGLCTAYFSDKFGRLPALWTMIVVTLISGFGLSFSRNFTEYAIARFFLGMGSSGRFLVSTGFMFELVGPKYRSLVGTVRNFGWISGLTALPLIAYILPNFRYIQLTSQVLTILLAFWTLYFVESPRWHLAMGKLEAAEKALRRILKHNSLPDDGLREKIQALDKRIKLEQEKCAAVKHLNVLHFIKFKNLRKYVLVIWVGYVCVGFVYYGIALHIGELGGNIFVNQGLAGLVEVPSVFVTLWALNYFNQRKTIAASYFYLTAVSCLLIVPFSGESLAFVRIGLALVGKFAINSCYIVLYVLGGEIYPTVLKNSGFGAALVAGRFGSMTAPFIKEIAEKTSMTAVLVTFGVAASVIGTLVTIFLPSTKDKEMPDTLYAAENIDKMKKHVSIIYKRASIDVNKVVDSNMNPKSEA